MTKKTNKVATTSNVAKNQLTLLEMRSEVVNYSGRDALEVVLFYQNEEKRVFPVFHYYGILEKKEAVEFEAFKASRKVSLTDEQYRNFVVFGNN